MAERLRLYPFEHYDIARRRWIRARYLATVEEATSRYPAVRVVGPPEIREGGGGLTAGHVARGPGGS